MLAERFAVLCKRANLDLPKPVSKDLFNRVLKGVFGLGPIQHLVDDPEVSEVMVNGAGQIWSERNGKLSVEPVRFRDDEHVMQIVRQILKPLGRKVDRAEPRVDARLSDGSRVNIIIPPCAIDGPTITIRKFPENPLTAGDLIRFKSMSAPVAEFFQACVHSALNIIVSGGTGSGKTTLLNVLSSYIPADERIITIEDAAELQLVQPHVVRLETAPPLLDGTGEMTIRELLRNSLRMRPDRIIVGECRGGEALDMLQAMNTGHDGSLTTIHANSPRDCIGRLETLCMMAGLDLPVMIIRQQIASAINLIVQQARLKDGTRKILQVTEVQGMEGDTVILQDIFLYQAPPFEGEGEGKLEPTGSRPRFMPQLENAGFKLGTDVFGMPDMAMSRRR
ncbi:MAG: CpaF family protein [Anaerolineales bacterium]|nr:CpaF family protein [Anaerolineales bacterium]